MLKLNAEADKKVEAGGAIDADVEVNVEADVDVKDACSTNE